MAGLAYPGVGSNDGATLASPLVPLGPQPPSTKGSQNGVVAIVLQTGKSTAIYTSGIVNVPVLGYGVILPAQRMTR